MNENTVFPHLSVVVMAISLLVFTPVALSTDIGSSPAAPSSIPAPPNPEKEDVLKSVPSAPDELKAKEVTDNAPAPIDPIISPGQQGAIKTSPITNSLAPPVPPDKEAALASVAEPNAVHPNVAQLEKRIAVLEDEVQALLAKQGKPSQVKAPFEVVDDKGIALMSVAVTNGITQLTLGDLGTTARFKIQGISASMIVTANEQNYVMLNSSKDGSRAMTRGAGITTSIGRFADGINGIVITDTGGVTANGSNQAEKSLAEIATLPGKKVALRLYDETGNAVVMAGTNPAAAGAGTVKVANTKGEPVAFLGTSENGVDGALGVAKAGKNVAAMLAEPATVALYNQAGLPIATFSKNEGTEGGNVTTRDPSGDGVFSAGYSEGENGGQACVYRAKKQNVFCLGIGVPGMGTGR